MVLIAGHPLLCCASRFIRTQDTIKGVAVNIDLARVNGLKQYHDIEFCGEKNESGEEYIKQLTYPCWVVWKTWGDPDAAHSFQFVYSLDCGGKT